MNPTDPTEPVVITPADILRAAAHYLYRHGWTQEAYYEPMFNRPWPAADALGAIGMAVHGHDHDNPLSRELPGWAQFTAAHDALNTHLKRVCDLGTRPELITIGDWNDLPEQTAESVITVLRAAADEWDRIHGGAA